MPKAKIRYTLSERSENPVCIVRKGNHFYVENEAGEKLTRKPKTHEECENWCVFNGCRNIGWNDWKKFNTHGYLGKTVSFSEIGRLQMVAGGEKKIKRVILQGELKEWVAIGWITLRTATQDDRKCYRTVVEDR